MDRSDVCFELLELINYQEEIIKEQNKTIEKLLTKTKEQEEIINGLLIS